METQESLSLLEICYQNEQERTQNEHKSDPHFCCQIHFCIYNRESLSHMTETGYDYLVLSHILLIILFVIRRKRWFSNWWQTSQHQELPSCHGYSHTYSICSPRQPRHQISSFPWLAPYISCAEFERLFLWKAIHDSNPHFYPFFILFFRCMPWIPTRTL